MVSCMCSRAMLWSMYIMYRENNGVMETHGKGCCEAQYVFLCFSREGTQRVMVKRWQVSQREWDDGETLLGVSSSIVVRTATPRRCTNPFTRSSGLGNKYIYLCGVTWCMCFLHVGRMLENISWPPVLTACKDVQPADCSTTAVGINSSCPAQLTTVVVMFHVYC